MAQAAFGVGVVALAAAVLPWRATVPTPPPVGEPTLPEVLAPTKPDAHVQTVDVEAIAERLASVANNPTPKPVEPVPTEPIEPVVAVPAVSYLGMISAGDRRLAMVKLDERQRVVREGGAVGEETIFEVQADFIRLGREQPGRRVERAQRQGDSTTRATSDASTPQPRPAGMNPLTPVTRDRNAGMRTGAGRAFGLPAGVPRHEAAAFRMIRNEVANDPAFRTLSESDRDSYAMKLLDARREELTKSGVIPRVVEGEQKGAGQ